MTLRAFPTGRKVLRYVRNPEYDAGGVVNEFDEVELAEYGVVQEDDRVRTGKTLEGLRLSESQGGDAVEAFSDVDSARSARRQAAREARARQTR